MSSLSLQDISKKPKYKSSSPNYLNYLILGVVAIGILAAAGIIIPQIIASICYGPVCGTDGVDYKTSCEATLAGASISNIGVCIRCNDPDDLNKFTSTTVSSTNGSLSDVCVDEFELNEAVCENDIAIYTLISCGNGYLCNEGACVEACYDGDFGENITIKSTTFIGDTPGFDDFCVSEQILQEYYCDNNTIQFKEIECSEGDYCINGTCTEKPCADSDNGKEVFIFGTITKGKDSFDDVCLSEMKLREYYCDDGEVEYEDITCPAGNECVNGKCQDITCTDSDLGLNQYTKGTVKMGTDVFVDSCYNPFSVLEYYCLNNAVETKTLSCGTTSECINGVCQSVDCKKTVTDSENFYVKYKIDTFTNINLILRKDATIELKGGYILELVSSTNETANFRLYQTFEEYDDSDELCEFSINNGSSLSKYCGKIVTKIEILNSSTNDILVEVGEMYSMQYYDYEKRVIDWTDSHVCDEDEVYYEFFNSQFIPYISTTDEDNELNLYNSKFSIFEKEATIKKIDLVEETIRFSFEGETYTIEDGESFEYENHDYKIYLQFNDYGLERMEIELD